MTDRPILFSGPMVQALLAGAKTQTRRTLARQPQDHHWRHLPNYNLGVTVLDAQGGTVASFAHTYRADPVIGGAGSSFGVDKEPLLPLRYAPGDRLWVRERWAVSTIYDGVAPRDVAQCGVRYAATDERLGIKDRPSIFMPRWASRLTLTVTHVRVQRLQEISEADAKAEGVPRLTTASRFDPDGCSIRFLVDKTGWSKTTIREAVAEITKRGVQMTSAVLCSYCGRFAHDAHEDHVAPRRHGGADEDSNIVPTCKSCNSSKSDTPLLVWLAQREVRS